MKTTDTTDQKTTITPNAVSSNVLRTLRSTKPRASVMKTQSVRPGRSILKLNPSARVLRVK